MSLDRDNSVDESKTDALVIGGQEALLKAYFRTLSEEGIKRLRCKIHEYNLRDQCDYFFPGSKDKWAEAFFEIAKEAGGSIYPLLTPEGQEEMTKHTRVPMELRGAMVSRVGFSPEHADIVTKWEIPSQLVYAMSRFESESGRPPIVGSVGCGSGNVEKKVLEEKRAAEVRGVDFVPGKEEEDNLRRCVHNAYLSIKMTPGIRDIPYAKLVKYVLRKYYQGTFVPSAVVDKILTEVFGIIDRVEKELGDTVFSEEHIWRACVYYREFIQRMTRKEPVTHENFYFNRIDASKKSAEEVTSEMCQRLGQVDVLYFGDSLHHSPDPFLYVQEGFKLLSPGGYMVISEPFVAEGDDLSGVTLGLVFETTNYPENILSLPEHDLWINYLRYHGAELISGKILVGVFDEKIKHDPYHRIYVVLKKPENHDSKNLVHVLPDQDDFDWEKTPLNQSGKTVYDIWPLTILTEEERGRLKGLAPFLEEPFVSATPGLAKRLMSQYLRRFLGNNTLSEKDLEHFQMEGIHGQQLAERFHEPVFIDRMEKFMETIFVIYGLNIALGIQLFGRIQDPRWGVLFKWWSFGDEME